MPKILAEFDSWNTYVETVANPTLRQWRRYNSSHTRGEKYFYGTDSFDEAIDMAIRRGWPAGRRMMQDAYAIVQPKPEPYRSQTYAVAGMFPSVPVFVAGSPECMVELENVDVATNPIVRIDYTNGGVCSVDARSLMLRGAAVLSLCDQLERRGYSTEINLVSETSSGSTTFDQRVTLKKAGEPIDLDRMAFALANPATHRRLHFALIEQYAELEPIFGGSYGSTSPTPRNKRPGAITIPGPTGGDTPASARLAVAIAAQAFLADHNIQTADAELVATKAMIY